MFSYLYFSSRRIENGHSEKVVLFHVILVSIRDKEHAATMMFKFLDIFTFICISVHGDWSPWAHWESCSVSCDVGVSKRHRTCTNPAPSVFGHYCIGDAMDFNICHQVPCNNITTAGNTKQFSSANYITRDATQNFLSCIFRPCHSTWTRALGYLRCNTFFCCHVT